MTSSGPPLFGSSAGRARFDAIVRAATDHDGQPPFSDQSLVDARTGKRTVVQLSLNGEVAAVAVVTAGTTLAAGTADTAGTALPAEAEFVVAPSARRRGLGDRLLTQLLQDARDGLLLWAHGDHPDARALAARHQLTPVRELLQLRLAPVHSSGPAAQVSAFRPGVDDAAWLALNAQAFAGHPEQGQLTHSDLTARLDEPWFDAEDFLIARGDSGTMTGFCWLKVEGGIGEFYAVAVAPDAQGTGLGRGLVNAGLSRLEASGIRISSLYVEGENTAALALYRSVGFTNFTVDVQYRSTVER